MEHKCPQCNSDLFIARAKPKSDMGSTDVFMELLMVCINQKCDNFAGFDLNNPKTVVKTIENKIN